MDRMSWMVIAVIAMLGLVGVMIAIGGPDALGKVISGTIIGQCNDTDGGTNMFLRGTMSTPGFVGTDYCELGNTPVDACEGRYCRLVEFFCKHPQTTEMENGMAFARGCPQTAPVCQMGACVEPTQATMGYIPASPHA